jgi:hypothetical protein
MYTSFKIPVTGQDSSSNNIYKKRGNISNMLYYKTVHFNYQMSSESPFSEIAADTDSSSSPEFPMQVVQP